MSDIKELVQKELCNPNFLIAEDECKGEELYTAIYFSSCGMFGENDAELFKKNIIEANTFQFFKTRVKRASKHIFVRDIQQKWYHNGINESLDSIDKVLEFLKEETKGTKIITLGSSAGGYAATLFGILLNAECIFSFSGAYSLLKYRDDEYSSIVDMVKESNIPIFYMVPSRNDWDLEQFDLVKDFENVYALLLKSSVHGIPVIKDILRKIINSDLEALKKMYNHKDKEISEATFILKNFGVFRFLLRMIKKNANCIINKYFKNFCKSQGF